MNYKTKQTIDRPLLTAVVVLGIAQISAYYVLSMQTQAVERRRAQETFELRIEIEKLKQREAPAS
ncbi:hypothetical protein [Kribbella monticola]|uniref:hypothetical protein n=1 Tax=Kribbella monticola TaxID=2185285 RepID=UPI000DD436C8|nr:hypothetical protein [Kribbella monticola]